VRAPHEKPVVIAGEAGALEGLYLDAAGGGEAGALVAAPHPLYGGSMDNPVVGELAFACSRSGIASLRFNWRGVGASAGAPSGDPADADADCAAALTHLAETVAGPLVACGYSFGAAVAVRAARAMPRVRRLVLVAPPPALCDARALAELDLPVLALAGERDRLAPPAGVAALVASLPDARLVAIPEADHFFASGLAQIGQATWEFLAATP